VTDLSAQDARPPLTEESTPMSDTLNPPAARDRLRAALDWAVVVTVTLGLGTVVLALGGATVESVEALRVVAAVALGLAAALAVAVRFRDRVDGAP